MVGHASMNEFTEGRDSFPILTPAYGRKMISSDYGYKRWAVPGVFVLPEGAQR